MQKLKLAAIGLALAGLCLASQAEAQTLSWGITSSPTNYTVNTVPTFLGNAGGNPGVFWNTGSSTVYLFQFNTGLDTNGANALTTAQTNQITNLKGVIAIVPAAGSFYQSPIKDLGSCVSGFWWGYCSAATTTVSRVKVNAR